MKMKVLNTNLFKKCITLFTIFGILVLFAVSASAVEKKSQASDSNRNSWLININTANVDQLVKLPRIGEKKARAIIEYREKNGKFKRIQDIMKVKGIGEKTFKNFEKMITV